MRTFLIISLLFLLIFPPFGGIKGGCQNLVPNPSFEDTIACPDTSVVNTDSISNLIFCKDWGPYWVTPDYFHVCSTNPEYQVPGNYMGNQNPATGNAYSGFLGYSALLNGIEYYGAQLLDTLSVGVKYYISLKLSLAEGGMGLGCACNKMGVKFTTVSYGPCPFCITHPLMNDSAHLYTNTIITDSVNWTTISGSFVADSAYTFISIGSFFSNSNIDTIDLTGFGNCLRAYYYVDDICVSPDSLTCLGEVGLQETTANDEISIYPNPAKGTLFVEYAGGGEYTVKIYNLLGNAVYEKANVYGSRHFIDLSEHPAGVYFVNVQSKHRSITNKIFFIK